MADYGITLSVGDYEGEVVETAVVSLGQNATPAVRVYLRVNGESLDAVVWLTEKSMPMARAQLKLIGFDPDRQSMDELDEKPKLLAGRKCPVRIVEDDYNGKLRKKAEIPTGAGRVAKAKLASLTQGLRAAASEETKRAVNAPAGPAGRPPFDDIPF